MYAVTNYIWSIVWFCLALGVVSDARAVVAGKYWRYALSLAFVAFGFSDIIEAKTGAWWQPTWLLFFKIFCIVSIVIILYKLRDDSKVE